MKNLTNCFQTIRHIRSELQVLLWYRPFQCDRSARTWAGNENRPRRAWLKLVETRTFLGHQMSPPNPYDRNKKICRSAYIHSSYISKCPVYLLDNGVYHILSHLNMFQHFQKSCFLQKNNLCSKHSEIQNCPTGLGMDADKIRCTTLSGPSPGETRGIGWKNEVKTVSQKEKTGWKSRGYPKAAGRNTHQTQHKRWLQDEELMKSIWCCISYESLLSACSVASGHGERVVASQGRGRTFITIHHTKLEHLLHTLWKPHHITMLQIVAMENVICCNGVSLKNHSINFLQLSDVQSPNHCFESLLLHRLGVFESINKGQHHQWHSKKKHCKVLEEREKITPTPWKFGTMKQLCFIQTPRKKKQCTNLNPVTGHPSTYHPLPQLSHAAIDLCETSTQTIIPSKDKPGRWLFLGVRHSFGANALKNHGHVRICSPRMALVNISSIVGRCCPRYRNVCLRP